MLQRYRDGEPVPELRNAIEGHLRECEWCRGEFRRIQGRTSRAPEGGGLPEPDPHGLSDLMAHLRNWESNRPGPEVRGPVIRHRAAEEIGRFLGANAALRITQPVSDDGSNLLPAIQPFLGRFLGRKAASHLSSHIVEVAVMRT